MKTNKTNGELLDLPPPAVIDSEVALLAGFTQAKRIDPDVFIRAEHFSEFRHRVIYQAMLDLEGEYGTWDDPALIAKLQQHPRWGKDGLDEAYAGEVFGSLGLPSMAGYHANRIIEAWRRRTIGNAAIDIFQASRNGFDTDELQRSLDRIRTTLDGEDDQPAVGQVVMRSMSDIHPQKISWLWPGRIPLGKYVEFIGPPGVGKSVLLCDLMARVSRGLPCPGGGVAMGPGGVLFMGVEDDAADTIRPRLDAAGADCSRIQIIDAVGSFNTENGKRATRAVSLATDISAIESAIKATRDCRLLVIDPIRAYIGKTDSHKDAEVRGMLVPIIELAAKYNIALVGISHFNKSNASKAIDRGMGSVAWTATARMAWGIVKDTDNPETRLMLPVKCNLAKDATGLSYTIADRNGVPVVEWGTEAVTTTVDDVLGASHKCTSPKKRDVKAWLLERMADGTVPANDILNDGKAEGYSERLLRWAKKETGIQSYREGFGSSCVHFWSLPENE